MKVGRLFERSAYLINMCLGLGAYSMGAFILVGRLNRSITVCNELIYCQKSLVVRLVLRMFKREFFRCSIASLGG